MPAAMSSALMSPIGCLLCGPTLSYPGGGVNGAVAWTTQWARLYAPAVTPPPRKPPPDEQRRQDALDELERLRQGGDTLGMSAMGQAARRAVDHLSAREVRDAGDSIEL